MLSVLQSSFRDWWRGEGGEEGEEKEGGGLETLGTDCDLRAAEVILADEMRGLGVAAEGWPSSPSSDTVCV